MASTAAAGSSRVLSVDILRGLTIAFMILVNDPGDWAHVYPQLDHAEWNGWTLTDLVFPNFLFLMGASLIFSLQARIARGDNRRALAGHILRRAVMIFAIKTALSLYPHHHWTHMRLYGVLTRIALCYLAAGLICLLTQRVRTLLLTIAVLLVGYWALLRFVPVPGFGMPVRDVPLLDPDGNLTAWIDRGVTAFLQRTIHTGSLYRHTNDPEGLLSTLPSIATTLLGSVAGLWLRRSSTVEARSPSDPRSRAVITLAIAAALSLLAAGLWSPTFPINKNLWTSSYVLLAGGISLMALALLYGLVDILRVQDRSRVVRAAIWPWQVFGSNAIVAYVVSAFIVETMLWIKLPDEGHLVTAWHWIYAHGFSHGDSTDRTSFAFAIAFVVACFLPNWLLWRKRIFLKI